MRMLPIALALGLAALPILATAATAAAPATADGGGGIVCGIDTSPSVGPVVCNYMYAPCNLAWSLTGALRPYVFVVCHGLFGFCRPDIVAC